MSGLRRCEPGRRRFGPGAGGASARRRASIFVLGALFVSLVSVPAALAAASPRAKLSPLQQGLRYYRGKTVTFISPTTAGQVFDVEQRLQAQYLSAYLHANVIIEDVPGAAQILGEDTTAGAAPNGLTIGLLESSAPAIAQLEQRPGVNFNPAREDFLAGNDPQEEVFLVQPTAPFTTFAELLHTTTSAHPLVDLATVSGETLVRLMLLSFGVPATYVTGYPNDGQLEAGFLRGDGISFYEALGTAGGLIPTKGRPLLLQEPDPPGTAYTAELRHVPTVAELLAKYPPKTRVEKKAAAGFDNLVATMGFTFFAPSATPLPQTLALRAAFKYTLTNKGYLAEAAQHGFGIGYINGAQAKADYFRALTALKPALQLVGLIPG